MKDRNLEHELPTAITHYLDDTAFLSAEESQAYLRLLRQLGRSGPLPNNIEALRRIAGVTQAAWASIWNVLRVFFEADGSNGLVRAYGKRNAPAGDCSTAYHEMEDSL